MYFVENLPQEAQCAECEKYAYMHSSEFKKIYKTKMSKSSTRGIEGYLSITNSTTGITIYRKYCGWSDMEGANVGLGYRSLCELGFNPKEVKIVPPTVEITPVSWFCYYWKNSDSGIRVPFRFATIGVFSAFISAISFLLQILLYIFPSC